MIITKSKRKNTLEHARGRAKSKRIMTVYIHRIKNKSYPSHMNISENEFKYWDEFIFNTNNLNQITKRDIQEFRMTFFFFTLFLLRINE